MKERYREKIDIIKKTCEKFKSEIYNCTFDEKDIRYRCYDAFIDHLDYFITVIPAIIGSNKRWVGSRHIFQCFQQ